MAKNGQRHRVLHPKILRKIIIWLPDQNLCWPVLLYKYLINFYFNFRKIINFKLEKRIKNLVNDLLVIKIDFFKKLGITIRYYARNHKKMH